MGMTFPLVVEAVGAVVRRGGGSGGLLYSLNTAGAALGCLAAGYVGVGLLGVPGHGDSGRRRESDLRRGARSCWRFGGAGAGRAECPAPPAPWTAARAAVAPFSVHHQDAPKAGSRCRPRLPRGSPLRSLVMLIAFSCGAVGLAARYSGRAP